MDVEEKLYTAEDLWALSHKAANKRLELIEGALVEMSPVGDRHSEVAGELYRLVANHVKTAGLGRVTTEAGFVLKPDTVCAPDVAYIARARLTPMTGGYYRQAPDMAAEVISPFDTPRDIRRKVQLYFEAGVRLVWVLYPDERMIDVYRPNASAVTLTGDDLLDGGDVIPGFAVAARAVFAYLDE